MYVTPVNVKARFFNGAFYLLIFWSKIKAF